MKWTLLSAAENQESFGLFHNDQKLLTLEFHPFTNSGRIDHTGEKRVFMIRKEGFLKNKIVLRNEYGMRMGQLVYDKTGPQSGYLELENEKFEYPIKRKDTALITMKNITSGSEAMVFEWAPKLFNLSGSLGPAQQFILMSTGWFLSMQLASIPVSSPL